MSNETEISLLRIFFICTVFILAWVLANYFFKVKKESYIHVFKDGDTIYLSDADKFMEYRNKHRAKLEARYWKCERKTK